MNFRVSSNYICYKWYLVLFLIFTSVFYLPAQDYEWLYKVQYKKGIIRVFSEDAVVIIDRIKDSERYVSMQLPDSWKRDSLLIVFSGRVGAVPPNVRMLGTPLKLEYLATTRQQAEKFGIRKRKLRFR
ncbi:MAG: hypothetical protein NZ522_00620 [Chitinophagales bacterium]|nr:hypothetical protein [Chitinophagales bacterium]